MSLSETFSCMCGVSGMNSVIQILVIVNLVLLAGVLVLRLTHQLRLRKDEEDKD